MIRDPKTIEVKKSKPLPVYLNGISSLCICVFIILLAMFILNFEKISYENYLGWFSFAALIAIIFLPIFLQNKPLRLYKDNANVVKYDGSISDSYDIEELFKCLKDSLEYLLFKRCEYIELSNSINIWSCFSYSLRHSGAMRMKKSNHNGFIFSKLHFKDADNISLILTNQDFEYLAQKREYVPKYTNLSCFLGKEDFFESLATGKKYISKYSNLPVFLVKGKESENLCEIIEKTCSDFFAKVRFKYVFTIKDGTISLGLKNARFGKFNRIFNKRKTKKLTDEAINEIADFLQEIKCLVEG